MTDTVLWLLAIQGAIGAFDTLYFHEWRARLPARTPQTSPELKVHAARDFLYAVIFGSLPWIAWDGLWTIVLVLVLTSEIALTMTDFVIEAAVRRPFGDVFPGERVTHGAMGIIYGAMLAFLIPILSDWSSLPSSLVRESASGPLMLHWLLTLMAIGVFVSGLRDLYAAYLLPHGHYPWSREGDA